MANNRIYLKCDGCGGTLFLGKRFVRAYYWMNYGKINNDNNRAEPKINYKYQDETELEDRLNQFFADHEFCGFKGLDHFSITYDVPPSEEGDEV